MCDQQKKQQNQQNQQNQQKVVDRIFFLLEKNLYFNQYKLKGASFIITQLKHT